MIRKLSTVSAIALLALLAAFGGFWWYWGSASPQSTCASCHEIENSSTMWAQSGHRNFHCKECHGTAFSNGLHSLKEKAMMVVHHFAGKDMRGIRLNEAQVLEMMDNCKRCHGTEYAGWISGGHSATYAAIFLSEKHNSAEQLNADCLRCHAMFFAGSIQDLVGPISRKGPWALDTPEKSLQHAIPCLACQKSHRGGSPSEPANYAEPESVFYARRPAPAAPLYYDRYEQTHVEAADLPVLRVREGDRTVNSSEDPLQRLCVQCHAPNAFHEAGTEDDRTPRGVHEGLSCMSCHDAHSNDAKQNCINCHPAISNCRLDVKKMNTTYADRNSPHNIHFVKCLDCHTKGIPRKREP